jgi:hypothetical protein
MMAAPWYELVAADASLDQGDLIADCPVLAWAPGASRRYESLDNAEALRSFAQTVAIDAVVMTQTCDLAQGKVAHVILCPHFSLDRYRRVWAADQEAHGQVVTNRSWGRQLDRVAAGQVWNLSMLNSEHGEDYHAELRAVDFHQVFTIPRGFVESWLAQRAEPRLRLRPPYREHLSQAFARFFMRVGLPTDIRKTW